MFGSEHGAMRVLALVTEAYGGRGGIAQYNRDFFGALESSADVASVDILPRSAIDPLGHLPAKVRQHAPLGSRLRYSAQAVAAARRLRPDVVFCGHLYMAPLAAPLAKLFRSRLIVQVHGVEIWQAPNAFRRRALEAADLVLCVSRDTRARVLAAAGLAPERALVVPNTVADDYVPGDRTAMRQELGLGTSFALLSVGRLDARERYKGHDRIIALLPAVLGAGRDVVYLIAGEGDDRARLERLAQEAGLSERVRFLGHVPRRKLPDLYRAADLFVLPSTGEGFGIVFLEAMACGTPALGLAVGGASDALGDGDLGRAASLSDLPAAVLEATGAAHAGGSELAASVRLRFGRPLFERCVHDAMARLHPQRPADLLSPLTTAEVEGAPA